MKKHNDKINGVQTEKGIPVKKSETTKETALRGARLATDESSPQGIALAAYSIWEQEGRPEGGHVENWLQAKAQIRSTRDIETAQG